MPATTTRTHLKHTTGRCPECALACPAEVFADGTEVFLERTCPEHGTTTSLLSSDMRFYHLSLGERGGCGSDCGCGPGGAGASHSPSSDSSPASSSSPFDTLSTCLALVEIVDSCNLACPTCYASSPTGTGADLRFTPAEEITARVQGVIDRKGPIEILQLSGGEPTLHPGFFDIVDWVHANPGVDYLLVNTNGIRVAGDDRFLERLARSVRYGHMQLYLQFDGTGTGGQELLRGADLRAVKARAVERCGEIGLPVTLAMTVVPENLDQLWDTVGFGLGFPHVRGAAFQPAFGSGRSPDRAPSGRRRLNTADIILAAVAQSGGKLRHEDFTPLPCGDPNCATIGYLLKVGGETRSISDFVDFSDVQGFLRDRVRYHPDDLARCGCESEPLGQLLKEFELDESHTFRLFIKPFMDAHSWDGDRIDRCCTHVIRPDGELDSFCRYYSGFSDCAAAPAPAR